MSSCARSPSIREWHKHGLKHLGSEPLTIRSPGLWAHTSDTEVTTTSPGRAWSSATSGNKCCPVTTLGVSGGWGTNRHHEHHGDTTDTDNGSMRRTRGPVWYPREPQELWVHAGKWAFQGWDLVLSRKDEWRAQPG